MRKIINTNLSGFAIGIVALSFLKEEIFKGAYLFSFGLSGIIYFGRSLFKGLSGFLTAGATEQFRLGSEPFMEIS